MRSFSLAIVGLLALVSSTTASFHWDVVGRTETVLRQQRALNDQLLEKAIPVKDFEAKYGVSLNRQLEENNYENFDYNNMYSFDGFSLTYAKCQPVQYFSENAVEEGNSSPMVVDDIVVLRLCPTKSCSDTKEYGCYTNFAEYAVELKDYLYVMLNFEVTKVQYMCNYCQECLNGYGGRQLEEEQQQQQQQNDYNNGNEDNQQEQDGENAYDQEQQQQQEEQFDQYYEDFGYDDQVNYDNACSGWDTYCSDYGDICVRNNNGGDGQENNADGNGYLSYRGYLDYLECNQAENKNGAMYFIKPRCDGTHNTIKMMAHYDANCYNSISEMSIRNFGLGMKDSAFQSFYSGECVACEESQYPPYDATNIMCNMIHQTSAQCVETLSYNPFEMDDTTECAYIESIRAGTYDESGTILLKSFAFTGEKITSTQKMLLTFFVSLSVGLMVYACYLHHAMTNLLIKSLSHRELLPPSRHASRRNSPRRTPRRFKKAGGESDWDDGNEFA